MIDHTVEVQFVIILSHLLFLDLRSVLVDFESKPIELNPRILVEEIFKKMALVPLQLASCI